MQMLKKDKKLQALRKEEDSEMTVRKRIRLKLGTS